MSNDFSEFYQDLMTLFELSKDHWNVTMRANLLLKEYVQFDYDFNSYTFSNWHYNLCSNLQWYQPQDLWHQGQLNANKLEFGWSHEGKNSWEQDWFHHFLRNRLRVHGLAHGSIHDHFFYRSIVSSMSLKQFLVTISNDDNNGVWSTTISNGDF